MKALTTDSTTSGRCSMSRRTNKEINAAMVAAAQRIYNQDGEIEIDDNAPISRAKGNPEKGAYVQAWVWVSDEDTK
jgi:hypothetical protein